MVVAARKTKLGTEQVVDFVSSVVGDHLHAKRVLSLAGATLGVVAGGALAINAIGQALAVSRGIFAKHAIKQVDRLLSNRGIDVWELFACWVPFVVAQRTDIVVAMDWTDFDADGHATIMLSMITSHGRATPLVWKTVEKASLKENRNAFEDEVLHRLKEVIPEGVKVLIVADRGFGDQKLYEMLTQQLGFDFVIRFRGNILVTSAEGETRAAKEWVGTGGRTRALRNATVTDDKFPVGAVFCLQAKEMKEAWCLATSRNDLLARKAVEYYAKRWTIEPAFRDTKDLRFGCGMAEIRVSTPARRDRLWLVNALAVALLTLLGAAGESLGYDRWLKANTVKTRTHSLFRQGCMLYDLLPTLRDDLFEPLMQRFADMIFEHTVFSEVFGYL